MSTLRVITRPKRKVSIGDMRERITLAKKVLSTQFSPPRVLFDPVTDVWASVVTDFGEDRFDDVNLASKVDAVFYIRLAEINSEHIIQFNDKNYRIVSSENFDGRNMFLKISCVLLGDDSKGVNV